MFKVVTQAPLALLFNTLFTNVERNLFKKITVFTIHFQNKRHYFAKNLVRKIYTYKSK